MEFITPINQNTIITKKEDPKDYSMSAFWDGFKQENLSMIAARNFHSS